MIQVENECPQVVSVSEIAESEPGSGSITMSVNGQAALPLASKIVTAQIDGQTHRMEYSCSVRLKVTGLGNSSHFTLVFEMKTEIEIDEEFVTRVQMQNDAAIPTVILDSVSKSGKITLMFSDDLVVPPNFSKFYEYS